MSQPFIWAWRTGADYWLMDPSRHYAGPPTTAWQNHWQCNGDALIHQIFVQCGLSNETCSLEVFQIVEVCNFMCKLAVVYVQTRQVKFTLPMSTLQEGHFLPSFSGKGRTLILHASPCRELLLRCNTVKNNRSIKGFSPNRPPPLTSFFHLHCNFSFRVFCC